VIEPTKVDTIKYLQKRTYNANNLLVSLYNKVKPGDKPILRDKMFFPDSLFYEYDTCANPIIISSYLDGGTSKIEIVYGDIDRTERHDPIQVYCSDYGQEYWWFDAEDRFTGVSCDGRSLSFNYQNGKIVSCQKIDPSYSGFVKFFYEENIFYRYKNDRLIEVKRNVKNILGKAIVESVKIKWYKNGLPKTNTMGRLLTYSFKTL
jgi:hypothetical protein